MNWRPLLLSCEHCTPSCMRSPRMLLTPLMRSAWCTRSSESLARSTFSSTMPAARAASVLSTISPMRNGSALSTSTFFQPFAPLAPLSPLHSERKMGANHQYFLRVRGPAGSHDAPLQRRKSRAEQPHEESLESLRWPRHSREHRLARVHSDSPPRRNARSAGKSARHHQG